jgi:predicted nucleic acid-binding protein
MLLVVKDACLLMDLLDVNLLDIWCRLEVSVHTTDLVLNEICQEKQRRKIDALLDSKSITKHFLDEKLLQNAVGLFRAGGISIPDASTVILARQLGAVLLTGDQKLRHTAEKKLITTHGMLWVLDYMIEQKVLNPRQAASHLESLCKRGSRYPKDECDNRIKKWKTP